MTVQSTPWFDMFLRRPFLKSLVKLRAVDRCSSHAVIDSGLLACFNCAIYRFARVGMESLTHCQGSNVHHEL